MDAERFNILSEADTKAKLIDPLLHKRGWTEDFIRREETARGINIIDGKPKRIIIDERHRSAWGKWSIVLKRNPKAIQIGLTATPCSWEGGTEEERKQDEEITANNLEYFGTPVSKLLAIILRTGEEGTSAEELAKRLLNHFGSLRAIDPAPIM
jgi:type I site-specific restriction endonuclease